MLRSGHLVIQSGLSVWRGSFYLSEVTGISWSPCIDSARVVEEQQPIKGTPCMLERLQPRQDIKLQRYMFFLLTTHFVSGTCTYRDQYLQYLHRLDPVRLNRGHEHQMEYQDQQADAPKHHNVPDEVFLVDVVVLFDQSIIFRVYSDGNPEVEPPNRRLMK